MPMVLHLATAASHSSPWLSKPSAFFAGTGWVRIVTIWLGCRTALRQLWLLISDFMSSGLIDWLVDFLAKEPTNMKGYGVSGVYFAHGSRCDINTGWTVCHAMASNKSSTSYTRCKRWAEQNHIWPFVYAVVLHD